MRTTYRTLAYIIAIGVVLQATFMAWAIFGFGVWIEEGNTFDESVLDCEDCGWNFTAERGFMLHAISGLMVIPLLALALLVVSFFAKVPGGVKYAATLVVLILLQVLVLPELARSVDPAFGGLHGLNALLIFAAAVRAGLLARNRVTSTDEPARVAV